MATLHSLFAIYAAVDRAAKESTDPGFAATVEQFLPGTTGANAGWSDEIREFTSGFGQRLPTQSLSEALNALVKPLPDPVGNPKLTAPQLSRLVFAVGTILHLPPIDPLVTEDLLVAALALAGPPDDSRPRDPELGKGLLDLLRGHVHSRSDWPDVMKTAMGSDDPFSERVIDPDVARIPLCNARLKFVRGHACAVLTTEVTSTKRSVNDVRSIVDLLNWDKTCPFFTNMTAQGSPHSDGWSRVLESVGLDRTDLNTAVMKTALKYWKGEAAGSVWVDYDLDEYAEIAAQGDGRVLVDEGYIRLRSTVGRSHVRGVRIKTNKVVSFKDLGFVATALFACLFGYADQGAEMMLFDGELKKPVDFEPSTYPQPDASAGDAEATTPLTPPTESAQQAVSLAADMLSQYVNDMAAKSSALADKFTAGNLGVPDLITFGGEVATRLALDPWRYADKLSKAPKAGSQ